MNSNFQDNIALSKRVCEKIHPLIKPISDLFEIHTFGYRKFFLNGDSFGISNNFSWTHFCLEKFEGKLLPNYETEIKSVLYEGKSHFSRIGKPDSKDIFLSALYELDIWNTCSLYKKTADGVEGFYFASTRENNSIIAKYINNSILLERFSYYFKEKLNEIINLQDIQSARSPTISPSVFESPQVGFSLDTSDIKKFLSLTPIHKFFLNVEGVDVTLSIQEFRCLALLSQGKTAKEIGNMLKISQRTVEGYIDNIKHKAKTTSRSHLIDLFLSNFSPDRDVLKYISEY